MSRGQRAMLAFALLIAGTLLILIGLREPSEAERAATADALVAGVTAGVGVRGSSLLATRAVADFGIGSPVRLVLVRILDALTVEVVIESQSEILLARPLHACLVGPDAAPDDAGLEDRCWGEAELGELIGARLPRDGFGALLIPAGAPVAVVATIGRGDERCDYPPGRWRLELLLDPVVAGTGAGPRYAPEVSFEIPFDRDAALDLVEKRRYCGLATKVYLEQGEPQVLEE